MVPKGLTLAAGRQLLLAQKHSPTLLFAGGVVGVIATTVAASVATLKVDDVVQQAKEDLAKIKYAEEIIAEDKYSFDDAKRDTVIVYTRSAVDIVKLYTPAFLLGAASVAMLTKSHSILMSRNAALTAAYAVLDQSFSEYRRRVSNEFGADEEHKLRHGYKKDSDTVVAPDGKKEVVPIRVGPKSPSGYARFFDQLCNNWSKTPEYNLVFLKCQQNYANDRLQSRGHIFLNEVYDMIGIERSRAGAVVGWVIGHKGDNYVDFGIFDSNNERARDFVNGREGAILLDFNVDGVIYDKI